MYNLSQLKFETLTGTGATLDAAFSAASADVQTFLQDNPKLVYLGQSSSSTVDTSGAAPVYGACICVTVTTDNSELGLVGGWPCPASR